MAKLVTATGYQIELSPSDFRRLKKRLPKEGNFYILDGGEGAIINMDQISEIIPTPDQGVEAAQVVDTMPQIIPDATTTEDSGDDGVPGDGPEEVQKLTSAEIRKIMTDNGLTAEQFAESIGYSQSSVRYALKGDRISADFEKAVRGKYGVAEVGNQEE